MNLDVYHTIAIGPFVRLYPVHAEEILAHTGIRSGSCLDVGAQD